MAEKSQTFVLKLSTVQLSVRALLNRDTHPFFIAYLWLRRQAHNQGSQIDIDPKWADLGAFLRVVDAPATRPYLRPFWKGARADGREWLNSNLAGSFAPSSLRDAPREVIDTTAAGRFILRKNHWNLALSKLLLGSPMSVVALSAFLFREYGFVGSDSPTANDLIRIFREEFGYLNSDQAEFQTLFSEDVKYFGSDNIFELHDEVSK